MTACALQAHIPNHSVTSQQHAHKSAPYECDNMSLHKGASRSANKATTNADELGEYDYPPMGVIPLLMMWHRPAEVGAPYLKRACMAPAFAWLYPSRDSTTPTCHIVEGLGCHVQRCAREADLQQRQRTTL